MTYLPVIDAMRLVSAILIVYFHTGLSPYKPVSLSGLAFFILLTFALQALLAMSRRSLDLRRRCSRLLVPWVVWSLFYGFWIVARKGFQPLVEMVASNPFTLLIGPIITLWYLPFAFLVGILSHGILNLLEGRTRLTTLLSLSLLTIVLAVAGSYGTALPAPFGQWLYAFPLMPIGLLIGLSASATLSEWRQNSVLIMILALGLSWSRSAPSYAIGVAMLLGAIRIRSRDVPFLRWCAAISLGIYLIHPWCMSQLYRFSVLRPWYYRAPLAVAGAVVLSAIILRFPNLSRLAFGYVHRSGPPGARDLVEQSPDREAANSATMEPASQPSRHACSGSSGVLGARMT